ncbi:MAG: flagellar biosynthesis protein FlhF [Thermodesulfobacteriota bacterium]|nr:flagellar biosynthesis protein FlhF [Thermodesulfobacteriota bacterium]
MKIKRFEAPDTRAALAMIKNEMGDDAIILTTRTISPSRRNGKKKNGDSSLVEVVAAIDYDDRELQQVEIPVTGYDYVRKKRTENDIVKKASNSLTPGKAIFIPGETPIKKQQSANFEARDLKKRFAALFNTHMTSKATSPPENRKRIPSGPTGTIPGKPDPKELTKWRNELIKQVQVIPLTQQIKEKSPTVICLVGATGVGKTTTVAKIAAWFSLRERRKVALISMDCYRIGATDQLRTYSQIMRLPCEIVLRKKDLVKAVAKHSDKDLIIVDTAGKSPYDSRHVSELKSWFEPLNSINPYLVISATTKKEDLASVTKAYSPLSVNGLILTKLDETRAYAALCQQVVSSSMPVSCVCTGQRVPEDFQMASDDFINKLFGQGWNTAMAS